MKKLLSLIVVMVLAATAAISQAPGIFNYQGVARNSVGNVLVNKTITLRLTIHDVSAGGPVVYQESRTVTTNPFGLFNVQVGSAGASSVTGTIAGVPWGVGAKFIQVEIDPNGGSSFINIGTAQIASVPYSLFATASGDLVLPFNKTQADAGTLFRINNSGTGISGAIMGTTLSNAANAWGVHGRVDNTSAGGFSSGILGTNLSTTGLGIGVTGSQNGSGWGVYGTTPSGIGVFGTTTSGTGVMGSSGSGMGVFGTSSTGNSGRFENTNAANGVSTVVINTNATSATALSVSGPGIWGSAIGITNTTSGMEWRTSVSGTTYSVTKVPGSTFSPFQLFSDGQVEFTSTLGTSRLRILDNGNVGMGTSTPTTRLHVAGTVRIVDGTQANNFILRSDANGNSNWADPAVLLPGSFLWTRVGTNMWNTNLGDNVGIGTNAPAAKLEIANSSAGSRGIQIINSVATNNSSAIYAQTNNITSASFFEGSAITGVMPLNVATTMLSGASTIKGIASTNAAVSQFSGIGVQGASAAGYGVVGNTNSGVALAGIGWGTGYGLYTFGKLQFEGQGAATNRIMTSNDANGNATWNTLASIGGVSGTGTTNFIPKWTPDGTTLGNSMAFDNGVSYSIGSTTPTTDLLYISNAAANTFATINQVGTNVGGLSFSRANAYKYDIAINAANDLYIQNYTAGSTAFTIRGANSNVGINQINPTAKLDVNGSFKLTDGTQGANKVLTSDAAGNASWQAVPAGIGTIFSSAWVGPSDPPSRDSSIDGTLTKVYVVLAPELTPAVIASGNISVYFRVGPVGPYELPYISNAGGRANAIQAILVPGKIIITRPTFNETAPNNINLPATLEFRYTIIQ